MKFDKQLRQISVAAVTVAVLAVGAVASAGPPDGKGNGKGNGKPPKDPVTTTTEATTTTTTTAPSTTVAPTTTVSGPTTTAPPANANADAEFVAMMIPHHFQATLMGQLAPGRALDESVEALAVRIDVEQQVEIGMMQNWQVWNGLDMTDAPSGYQMMLGMPMMLERMGMATPAEMDQLAASSGADFDRLYLELMIEHHEGALRMLVDVITHGTDTTLQFWATDMLNAQTHQIAVMQEMLADLG